MRITTSTYLGHFRVGSITPATGGIACLVETGDLTLVVDIRSDIGRRHDRRKRGWFEREASSCW